MAEKKEHIGDLFRYFNGDGYVWYQWEQYSTIVRDDGGNQVFVIDYRWKEVSPIPGWFDYIKGASLIFMGIRPTPPYSIRDLWLNGGVFLHCIKSKTSSENFNEADWDDARIYDNTQTTIDGGIVTSGTIQLAGSSNNILAGITGEGKTSDSVRLWSGASFTSRNTAPFRVLQDGSVVMTNANVTGKLEANENSLFRGNVSIADGKILLSTDGSGSLANGKINWDTGGNINVSNATMTNATVTGKLNASQGLRLNETTTLIAGTYHSPITIDLNNYTSNVYYLKRDSNDNVASSDVRTTIILPSNNGVNMLFIFIDDGIACDVGFISYGQSIYCFQWRRNALKNVLLLLRKINSNNSLNPWSVLDFDDSIGGAT